MPDTSSEQRHSSSTSLGTLCTVCKDRCSIYTCPRCKAHTCSLQCSRGHKSATGCTGERDKAAYVPINEYGWGVMMNDYTFLEEVGRQVGEWGREIARGGYGREQVRGRGGRGRATGGTKRDILRLQLEARDIDMELLPVGMERRKHNYSYWDYRKQTALLTIEFKFYSPRVPLSAPFALLTHKNSIDVPLLSLIQQAVERASVKKQTAPEWVKHLVLPHTDGLEPFHPPDCTMGAQLDPKTWRSAARHRLEPSKTLRVLLQHTHFTEFPTIEVWEAFDGTIVDTTKIATQSGEQESKRRKVTVFAQKETMNALLGEYGSDEDRVVEGREMDGLSSLGEYVASDEDEQDGFKDDGTNDDEIDPAALLELVREVQGKDKWDEEDSDGNDEEM